MYKYKIVALAENQINNDEILIALLSIVNTDNFYESTILTQNYVFVFALNSITAKSIAENPEEDIFLNLNDFSLKKIKFDDISNSFGYFHKDLENKIYDELSSSRKYSYDLTTSLTDCSFSCYPEMFFYFQYKVIILREFKNQMENLDKNLLFNRFSEVIGVILMDAFKILTDTYKSLSETQIDEIRSIYYDNIDYVQGYSLPIVLYVTNNETAKKISCEIMGDNYRLHQKYIQELFIKSLEIVEKRIMFNGNKKTYFAHEIVIGSNEVQLKIFPTLYALTRLEEVAKKWEEGKLLIDYLERNNFTQLKDSEIDIKEKTKYVFSHPEIINPFFNDLSNSLSLYPFGRQKRNKMLHCLFNQGQVNFTLYKST